MLKKLISKLKFAFYLIKNYKNSLQILFFRKKKTIKQISLRNGITFVGNQKSQLLEITTEIFFDQVYTFKIKINQGDIVVDIGANIGVFSVFAASNGASHVFAYEPFPENIKLIKKNSKLNGYRTIVTTQAAVSDKLGQSKLYLGSVDSGNLLFDHNSEGKLSTYVQVPTVTLESIFKTHHLSQIDFLKIDCEGSEGAIFQSTPDRIWKKIERIALEFHDNVSIIHHAEIEKRLSKLGYKTDIVANPDSPFGYIYAFRS
ncbi:MAG: FkbM family methyltransferase [Microgenomates group bacterium]